MDFVVLGHSVRLGPEPMNDEDDTSLLPEDVVSVVKQEAKKIQDQAPGLSIGQVAVLVALKLASDKLRMEKDFKDNLLKLELTAKDALSYIEEVAPSTH